MIMGNDILSKEPEAFIEGITKGYLIPCNSEVGICWDILDTKHYNDKGVFYNPNWLPCKPKTSSKFYLKYIIKHYRNKHGMSEFRRNEVYLQDGTPIFINDIYSGHGHGSHMETLKIAKLFKKYRVISKGDTNIGPYIPATKIPATKIPDIIEFRAKKRKPTNVKRKICSCKKK